MYLTVITDYCAPRFFKDMPQIALDKRSNFDYLEREVGLHKFLPKVPSFYLICYPIHDTYYLSIFFIYMPFYTRYLFNYLPKYPSIHLSMYVFVYPSIHPSVHRIHPSIHPHSFHPLVFLCIQPSIYPFIYQSMQTNIHLPIDHSI